jgi:hypothetical protein
MFGAAWHGPEALGKDDLQGGWVLVGFSAARWPRSVRSYKQQRDGMRRIGVLMGASNREIEGGAG